ncbi:MAG: VCBS repeat-containing protein [Saprospiraceae bacterium]|nr:VCBS repeat-containing protein [Saprospiraceae bacterium]
MGFLFRSVLSAFVALLYPTLLGAQALFEWLPPAQTGVDFVNRIEEDSEEDNVLAYEYFYNGGGVAAGDLNNDGRIDLYFTANRETNRLYLNQGNLKFEDITRSAGVGGRRNAWKTGVTLADVNADGWLDIYVCYSGRGNTEARRNQLFINNQDLSFSEKAAAYGLDDPGYGTQAAFFDFDLDGDLDCFLLNHNIKEYRNFENDQIRRSRDPLAGDKLLENQNGKFVDISERAGIPGNPLGFGLGLAVSDLNLDGWPDLYISNDYNEPDYLLLNDGKGHFTDAAAAALGHMSHFSMGCDIADVNNDGRPDILTLDMLPEDNRRQKLLQGPENYELNAMMVKSGRHHQYMRNMLHLNTLDRRPWLADTLRGQPGEPRLPVFEEIGQLAGLANTDWSWSALLADFDNDGWQDVFITNGYLRDYTNRDFLRYWGDYLIKKAAAAEPPSLLELVQKMPSSKISNYLFRNNGDLTFSNMTEAWGMDQPAVSNGATYADLDNDGDLEIVVNNINEPAFIYKNKARETNGNNYIQLQFAGTAHNTKGIGTQIRFLTGDGRVQWHELMATRGYQSAVPEILHIGLGQSKTPYLQISRPETPGQWATVSGHEIDMNRRNTLDWRNNTLSPPLGIHLDWETQPEALPGTGPYLGALPRHTEYDFNDFKRQPLLPYMLSRCGPAMAAADVNGDGLQDLFFGGAKWSPGNVFFQTADQRLVPGPDSTFRADLFCTDADALFFDADADGDADLYVASGGYSDYRDDQDPNLEDRLYQNDGAGHFTKREGAVPGMPYAKSCVRAADVDADGDTDLFVGGRVIPGYYPIAPPSYILLNEGKGQFRKAVFPNFPERPGMVTDAAWVDLNHDRRPDLVLCGEWMPIRVFLNTGNDFEEHTLDFFDKPYAGLWNRLLAADLDRDGDIDLVGGNFGRNSQLKASDREPLRLVFNDFDQNGSVDPILCAYNQGNSYPFLTRDELLDQIAAMRPRFTSYEKFADATLTDMFTPEELRGADTLLANHLETTFFENKGGRFEAHVLPAAAQVAPVSVVLAGPGPENRLWLFGNQQAMRLRLGQMDANSGVLLEFQTGKGYQRVAAPFHVSGDVRSGLRMALGKTGQELWLLGRNNAAAAGYSFWPR